MQTASKAYFIQEFLLEKVFNGSIGNVDLEKVMLQNGVLPIFFPFHFEFTVWAKIARLCFLIKTVFSLPSGAIIFFQYPYYSGMSGLLLSLLLRFRKNTRLVCILAEINGLKYDQPVLLKKEINRFRRYHYFIVHNESMQRWLNSYVPGKQSAQLEFFDFLAGNPVVRSSWGNTIIFAGNLAESGFLQELHEVTDKSNGLIFQIYGQPFPAKLVISDRIQYKGVFEPYKLPHVIEGSYGLVWDGDHISEVSGSMGPYMRYISHHKVSLYILCGLPLIVWEQCGSAALVRQYNIGITVGNLFEIKEKIAAITESEYQEMSRNTRGLAKKIAEGGCTTAAFRQIMDMVEKGTKQSTER